jgi:hypothetical protein
VGRFLFRQNLRGGSLFFRRSSSFWKNLAGAEIDVDYAALPFGGLGTFSAARITLIARSASFTAGHPSENHFATIRETYLLRVIDWPALRASISATMSLGRTVLTLWLLEAIFPTAHRTPPRAYEPKKPCNAYQAD